MIRPPVIGDLRQGLQRMEMFDGTKWVPIESQMDRIERKLDQLIKLIEANQQPAAAALSSQSLVDILTGQLIQNVSRSKCE